MNALPDPPTPATPVETALAWANRHLVSIATIFGSSFAVYTGITQYIDNNINRYGSFQTAYKSEEAYWKDLYDRYIKAVDKTDDADGKTEAYEELYRAHIMALNAFASKEIPNFNQYRLGFFFEDHDPQQKAIIYLSSLRSTLRNAIADPKTTGQIVLASNFDSAEMTKERPRNASGEVVRTEGNTVTGQPDTQTSTASVVAEPVGSLSYATKVIAVGNAKGYDVDVFWCVGSREARNFAIGGQVAQKLAALSLQGEPLANQIIGRVRLRPLPIEKQTGGYPSSGYLIRYDKTEEPLAKAMANLFKSTDTPAFSPVPGTMNTQWYLSVFVC